jgi:hypothetical protein
MGPDEPKAAACRRTAISMPSVSLLPPPARFLQSSCPAHRAEPAAHGAGLNLRQSAECLFHDLYTQQPCSVVLSALPGRVRVDIVENVATHLVEDRPGVQLAARTSRPAANSDSVARHDETAKVKIRQDPSGARTDFGCNTALDESPCYPLKNMTANLARSHRSSGVLTSAERQEYVQDMACAW